MYLAYAEQIEAVARFLKALKRGFLQDAIKVADSAAFFAPEGTPEKHDEKKARRSRAHGVIRERIWFERFHDEAMTILYACRFNAG